MKNVENQQNVVHKNQRESKVNSQMTAKEIENATAFSVSVESFNRTKATERKRWLKRRTLVSWMLTVTLVFHHQS